VLGEQTTRKLLPQASQSSSKDEIIRLPPMDTMDTWVYNGPPSSRRWHGKIPTALTYHLICVSIWLVGENSSSVEAYPVINRVSRRQVVPLHTHWDIRERDQVQQADISNALSADTTKCLTRNPVQSTKDQRWHNPFQISQLVALPCDCLREGTWPLGSLRFAIKIHFYCDTNTRIMHLG